MSSGTPIFSYTYLLVTLMYIAVIAWIYVALMMSVAEANNSNGSLLGAFITFLLYGVMPVGILIYIMGTPGRKRQLRAREAADRAAALAERQAPASDAPVGDDTTPSVGAPDTGGHAPADALAPVRKEI